MVKNVSGGNKTKKQKRNYHKYDPVNKISEDQMFAQIKHNNGGTFDVLCSDGVTRKGKLSGEMKKGPRLLAGSYVVITLRDFEADKKNCDIIAHGDPANDIINIFKKYDLGTGKRDNIDFVDSDDEFKDFEESKKTTITLTADKDNKDNNENKDNGNNYDWGDFI
jgi:translation initiation factor IF-1